MSITSKKAKQSLPTLSQDRSAARRRQHRTTIKLTTDMPTIAETVSHSETKRFCCFPTAESISLFAEETDARILLIAGKPIREPIAWYGPIVMNTNEEISAAYEELENGTFIKE